MICSNTYNLEATDNPEYDDLPNMTGILVTPDMNLSSY